jgi:hypothetical protein
MLTVAIATIENIMERVAKGGRSPREKEAVQPKEIGTKTCSTKREQRRNNRSGGSTKWRIEDARSRMNDVGNEK